MKIQFLTHDGTPVAMYVDDRVGASMDVSAVAERRDADPPEIELEEFEADADDLRRLYGVVSDE